MLQRGQFAQRACSLVLARPRDIHRHQDRGGERQRRDDAEAPSPAGYLAEPIGERHSHDGRDRQTEQDVPDSPGALICGYNRGCDEHCDAKIGAVRQAAQKAETQHPTVVWDNRGQTVGERVESHQRDEKCLARQSCREHRYQRGAHYNAEGVGTYDVPRHRHTDLKIVRHVRQKTHGRKFGGSNRKPSERQHEMNDTGPERSSGVHTLNMCSRC